MHFWQDLNYILEFHQEMQAYMKSVLVQYARIVNTVMVHVSPR
jgi:hypothetical protein